MDLFTPEYKRYKARRPLPDFSEVIDVNNIENHKPVHKVVKIDLKETNVKPVCGFKPCHEWDVFRFPDYPGYIVIRNPFLDGYQRYWVSRCLQDFSADKRNSTNLTNLGHFEYFDVWEDFVTSRRSTFTKDDPLWKLRWATLGYHYGWNTKEYSEHRKAEFPIDVQCLSQYFSHCLGFGPFRAEAGIVNYYHLDSALGGHTDHSELDHTAPLLSFSFGQACVFLLGGPTKETKPMAIYLRSGDVCVMSKEARLAYHAVPKILTPENCDQFSSCFSVTDKILHVNNSGLHCKHENGENGGHSTSSTKFGEDHENNANTQQSDEYSAVRINGNAYDSDLHISISGGDEDQQTFWISEEYTSYIETLNERIEHTISELDWSPFEVFLQASRINMNLRQVLPPGCSVVEPKVKDSSDKEVKDSSNIEGY